MPPRQPQPLDPQHVVALRSQLADTFAALFARAGYVELAKLGVGDPVAVFDAKRPDIQERALKLADDTLGRIARTAGDRVRHTISEQLGEGKDQFQIAEALREAFAGMSQRQARTVMRTVTRDLYNGASLDAYEAIGITHAVAHDGFGGLTGKTDPDCVARNGKRYTIAQAREQEHSPVTHPNCTLHWTPDVTTMPEDGPIPGLEGLSLAFDPAEPRDYHGRWRDEFNIPSPDVPIPGVHAMKPVFDLKEKDLPLADRAEFQSQRLLESLREGLIYPSDANDDDLRVQAKKDVARHLRARLVNDPRWKPKAIHAIESEAVAALVDAWATTSGDHDQVSMAIQVAAARELLGTDPRPSRLGGNAHGASAADLEVLDAKVLSYLKVPGVEDSLRAFARAQYEATQLWLAKRGIKRVYVARGLSLPDGTGFREEHGQAEITMNPLSSWALDPEVAADFAKQGAGGPVLLLAEVPAERIISLPRTGAGCLPETEVIVLGGKPGVPDVVLQWHGLYNWDAGSGPDAGAPASADSMPSIESIMRLWGLV